MCLYISEIQSVITMIIGRFHGKLGKVLYGRGNLGTSLLWVAFSISVIFFYTDVIRLSPWLVGSAYAIYGAWNAINDPTFLAMGSLILLLTMISLEVNL